MVKGKDRNKGAKAKHGAPTPSTPAPKPEWPQWERKLEAFGKRDYGLLAKEWAAHLPHIEPRGSAPIDLIHSISAISDEFKRIERTGSVLAELSGGRSATLHEAIYMLHKAVHVQMDVAQAVAKGRHTWAYVNGYQGALFALTSVLAFLGITSGKDPTGGAGVIVIDVWPKEAQASGRLTSGYEDKFKLIRFRELDHYQKWALLKRALRQTRFKREFISKLSEALDNVGDRDHAIYRNEVNYISNSWLSEDLLIDVPLGPIKPATSFQEHYDNIYEGTQNGSVYTMVALIEVACSLLEAIGTEPEDKNAKTNIELISQELKLLERRFSTKHNLCAINWAELA